MILIEEVNNYINTKFDLEIKLKLGEEFECYLDDDIIYISEDIPEDSDIYLAYCKKLGLHKKVDLKILSLLHEVGHFITDDDNNDFDIIVYDKLTALLIERPSKTEILRRLKLKMYFNLAVERRATQWAINYINQNDITELEQLMNYNQYLGDSIV